jgi:hypothetical protein
MAFGIHDLLRMPRPEWDEAHSYYGIGFDRHATEAAARSRANFDAREVETRGRSPATIF